MFQARIFQLIVLSSALSFALVLGQASGGDTAAPAGGSEGDLSNEGTPSRNLPAPNAGADNAATPAEKSGSTPGGSVGVLSPDGRCTCPGPSPTTPAGAGAGPRSDAGVGDVSNGTSSVTSPTEKGSGFPTSSPDTPPINSTESSTDTSAAAFFGVPVTPCLLIAAAVAGMHTLSV
ncbi:hypothetical protein CROQUDRAFT_85971 [Cronartium quercuum f. sp. fusiforme G11]|uniref:Uncharacterized protein n=1 Tax=Cronartium quercuum f. sp. fusiforme G11 TaxID=708437 RepID=A0A9P6THM5_9BASI|nr:hypothetical protein CROQUDRAFT_85971 [Cronartium quercuum f. sp. fusiforme G11]